MDQIDKAAEYDKLMAKRDARLAKQRERQRKYLQTKGNLYVSIPL
jgi:hypothetical protein